MRNIALSALTAVATAWATVPSVAQETDIASGERLFRQRCGACHQIATTRNGVGPHLQAVIGRAAGSVEGFNYSPALNASAITWTPETLETYLQIRPRWCGAHGWSNASTKQTNGASSSSS
ncbi:hypothetical protein GCM10010869_55610 [Mesorhizobium tianshanense]|uniref:Cytochrome c n=1 Tax=Mesorhizobium tianshanense TaxID=39844 RepID=A0A562N734_9HYPH|nr:c-type cytochrome [Mesorhizobium tianshanense]TWI27923.1 cytochrome c [Mesorhizobium tianshanense]GLS39964.1 hypothetical protein GCM10010869_55610 [Mesorhizobium tianshanense]